MSHGFGKFVFFNVLKGNGISLVPLYPFEGDRKHRVKCTLCFLTIDKSVVPFNMCAPWTQRLESSTMQPGTCWQHSGGGSCCGDGHFFLKGAVIHNEV